MPAPPPPEIVVAGHVCLDVIPTYGHRAQEAGKDGFFVPGRLVEIGPPVLSTGGAVSNTGLALHRLGVRTRLIGKVGSDLFGRAVLDHFRAQGTALADGMIVSPDEATSYTLVLSPPGTDRMFLHCPGANDTFRPAELDAAALAGARCFHFGYPPLMQATFTDGGEGLAALFGHLRAAGMAVSLDMASPDPAAPAGQVDWLAWLGRVLPHVDLFAPSFDELCFMLGAPACDPDADRLARLSDPLLALGVPLVLIKLGAHGLYLRTADAPSRFTADAAGDWQGRELLTPCFAVDVAGTTGAGDCTIAGFLAALLHGQSPEAALTSAVAVGACSVEQTDATSGVRPWADVQARLQGWPRRDHGLSLPAWAPLGDTGCLAGPRDHPAPPPGPATP